MILKAAVFAKFAYRSGGNNIKTKNFGKFGEFEYQYFKRRDTEFYIISNHCEIFFVFRGTSDMPDFIDGINFGKRIDSEIGQVHEGFYEKALDVISMVEERMNSTTKRIFLVGHSMGGAVAKIIAMKNPEMKLTVITFGEPKEFNHNTEFPNHTYIRVVNHLDVVSRSTVRFKKFGVTNETVMYIDRHKNLIENPSAGAMFSDNLLAMIKNLFTVGTNPIADHFIDSYITELSRQGL